MKTSLSKSKKKKNLFLSIDVLSWLSVLLRREFGIGMLKLEKLSGPPKMFELFGLDPQEHKASFTTWENALYPKDREEAKNKIDFALNNHSFLDNKYRIIRPDGEIRWINALGEGEYDETGNPLSMSGICIDIT